jgi:hypothetical protein
VYPDRRSKQSLTGHAGDGHALASAAAVPVIAGPGFETIVTHEATHVLATRAWGVAGTPLVGEGGAVWVTGEYGGRALDAWRRESTRTLALEELVAPSFVDVQRRKSYRPRAWWSRRRSSRSGSRGFVTTYVPRRVRAGARRSRAPEHRRGARGCALSRSSLSANEHDDRARGPLRRRAS